MTLGDNIQTTIQTIYQRCIETISSIKNTLSTIANLFEESPLNRLKCAQVLSDLRSKLEVLFKAIKNVQGFVKEANRKANNQLMKNLPFELQLLFSFCSAWGSAGKVLENDIESLANKSNSLGRNMISKIGSDYLYSEQHMFESLYDFLSDLKVHIEKFEVTVDNELNQLGYGKVRHIPLSLIFDLVTFKVRDFPKLNDRWACAACYLASLEVTVNKACKELGIKVQTATKTDDFKKRLEKLTQNMKQKGVEIIKIEKDIVSRLYDYRNSVLHGGYIPNDDEFDYIVRIIPKFIQSVQACL